MIERSIIWLGYSRRAVEERGRVFQDISPVENSGGW